MYEEEVNLKLLNGQTWKAVERFHKQHSFFLEIKF